MDELELLRLKKKKLELELELSEHDGKKEYEDASKSEVAAEVARSFGRGGKDSIEFFGDVYDVARASVDQFIPGMEDRDVIDQLNPFAPPDPGDIARQEALWDTPLADELTREDIRRGGHKGLDAAKTFSEYLLPTITGGPQGGIRKAVQNAVVTGGGAALGEAAGNEFNETAGTVGEVAGALGGGLFSQTALAKGRQMLSEHFNVGTSDDLLERALEAVMKQADDPAAAQAAFLRAIEDGDAGTLADLMGDAGVYNVEALIQDSTSLARSADNVAAQRSDQIVGDVMTEMDVGDATQIKGLSQAKQLEARKRVNAAAQRRSSVAGTAAEQNTALSLAAQEAVTDTANQAQEVVDQLAVSNLDQTPVSVASEKLSNTYDLVSDRRYQKDVKPLWNQFDSSPDIDASPLADGIDDAIDTLDEVDQLGIRREFADEIAGIKAFDASTPPKKVHRVISMIKNKMANVPEAKRHQALMVEMNKGMEQFLESSSAGTAYKKARDAESKFSGELRPSGISKARNQAKEGEVLASKMAKNLEAGAVTADQIIGSGSPAIIKQFKDTMTALATRANNDSPAKFQNFLRQHEELLRKFPDLDKRLRQLETAQVSASDAAKTAKTVVSQEDKAIAATESALKQARNKADQIAKTGRSALMARTLADFADEPRKAINTLINSENAARDMSKLAKHLGTPGRAHLKSLIAEEFTDAATKNGGRLDASVIKRYDDMKPMLREIMSDAEIDAMDAILGKADSFGKREAARYLNRRELTRKEGMASSAFAAVMMKILPGNSLIMAGAAKQYMKDLMLKNPDPAIVATLSDMVNNPQRFEAAVRKYKPKNAEGMKSMLTAMGKDIGGWATGTTTPPVMVISGDDDTVYQE